MFQSIYSMQSLDNRIATHHQICPLPGTFHTKFDEPHRKPTVTFAPLGPRSMPFWCRLLTVLLDGFIRLTFWAMVNFRANASVHFRSTANHKSKQSTKRSMVMTKDFNWIWKRNETCMGRGSNRIESNRFGLDWIGSYEIVWDRLLFVRVVRVGRWGRGKRGGLRVPHNNCQQIYEHVS